MIKIHSWTISCGDRQIEIMNTSPEEVIEQVKQNWIPATYYFATEAENIKETPENKLAEYIRQHELGEIKESTNMKLPRSQKKAVMWMWTLNKTNLLKHKTA